MIPITEDNDYYMQCLTVYYNGSSAGEILCKSLVDKIPDALQRVWANNLEKEVSVLSVGGGDGAIDTPMLSAIAQRFGTTEKKTTIYNTVVEPNAISLRKYKDQMECLLEKRAIFHNKFFEKTFHGYVAELESNARKFDLVHFIFCLYYFPGQKIEPALEFTFSDLLKEKGVIVVVLADSGDHFGPQFVEFNKRRFGDRFYDVSLTAEHVTKIAKKNNWKYDTHRYVIKYDITEVLLDEESEKANMLLDFYTHYKDFRKTAGEERLAATLEFIRGKSEKDEEGRLRINDGFELVVIYKDDS